MAALLSVLLRIRCQSGGRIRPGTESELTGVVPYLPLPESKQAPSYLPRTTHASPVELQAADGLLRAYPMLRGRVALALTRACALYQQAIWSAEADPSDAWLRLVSAIETAANAWARDNKWKASNKRSKLFEQYQPDLAGRVKEACATDLYKPIADFFGQSYGAGKLFADFIVTHAYEPSALIDSNSLRNYFGDVYKARSQRLHSGIPMPMEMVSRYPDPEFLTVTRVELEREVEFNDGSIKTSRLSLHAFEALVRSALVSWWERLGAQFGSVESA